MTLSVVSTFLGSILSLIIYLLSVAYAEREKLVQIQWNCWFEWCSHYQIWSLIPHRWKNDILYKKKTIDWQRSILSLSCHRSHRRIMHYLLFLVFLHLTNGSREKNTTQHHCPRVAAVIDQWNVNRQIMSLSLYQSLIWKTTVIIGWSWLLLSYHKQISPVESYISGYHRLIWSKIINSISIKNQHRMIHRLNKHFSIIVPYQDLVHSVNMHLQCDRGVDMKNIVSNSK